MIYIKSRILSVLITVVMLFANVVTWAEGSIVLSVFDDTAIFENEPDTSKMNEKKLRIHTTGSSKYNKEAWIRFDMSEVNIPVGMRIKEATLSLYFTGIANSKSELTDAATATVWSLTSSNYDEAVTWNTTDRPVRAVKLATGLLKSKFEWTEPFWLDFDVTAYARNSEDDLLAFSVWIQGKSGSGAYVASSEYSDGKYAPKLSVELERDPYSVMTILPSADASVDYMNPDKAYGVEDILFNNALFDFSLDSAGDDNPNITDKSGYFGVDITGYVSEHYSSDKACRFFISGDGIRVHSKDGADNKPYIEIIFDGKKIHSAFLYMYGDGRNIKLCSVPLFDEKSVTASSMPSLGEEIQKGGTGKAFKTTVEGYTDDVLANTYYMALDPKNAYPSVNEVFNLSGIPSVSEIELMFNGLEHPYLLSDYDGFERIKALNKTDSYIKKWYEAVKTAGEKFLTTAPSPYNLRGGALSSNVDDGAMTLAFLYRTADDESKKIQYAQRCMEYLNAAVEYPDFNPPKMLNVGEMSRGVALAYDWLYDYEGFSDTQKKAVEQTLVEKALNVIIETKYSNHNNWNHVVNGGVTVAALAVGNADSKTAAKAIYQTTKTLPTALRLYYPDGVFIEASGYYEYASSYLGPALAALESTFGTDFGLGDIKGIAENGYYPIYTKGYTNKQAICYGDGKMAPVSSPFMLYLAQRFNNTDYGMYQREADTNDIFSILWYNPESYKNAPALSSLPEDYFADGVSQIASMRDGWEDENALFAGIKGGYNTMSHGDFDIGSFYIGAYGESFTKELDGVDYHSEIEPEVPYFRLSRYTYYSKSPQGHNTIVINQPRYYPDMSFGQNIKAKGDYVAKKSVENESFAIIDITNAYAGEVNYAYRGLKLDKANDRIIISDKINAKKPSDVWWFMHTDADIVTNGNSAVLSIGDKKLYAEIISDSDAEFYVMNAEPLPHTPTVKNFDSVAHIGEKKLAVRLREVVDEELQICFSLKENDISEFSSLLEWGGYNYGKAELKAEYKSEATLTDDCSADERNGGIVNNNGDFLKVMWANYGYNYQSFMRFEHKEASAEIDKVVLTLHAVRNDTINNIPQKEETVVLYPASGRWSENTLTEKNAPEIITEMPIATATVPYNEGTKVLDEYITFDITDWYKSLSDKSEVNLALKLTSRKNGCVYFDDKESGVAPKLEISYKTPLEKTVSIVTDEENVKAYLCKKTGDILESVKIYDFENKKAIIEPFDGNNTLFVWNEEQTPVWFVMKE